MTTLAALAGVTHRYGDVVALDDIDLEIGDAELVGLLGPNGAGKTTLLSLLQGLRRPIYEEPEGGGEPVLAGFEVVRPGLLSEAEYDQVARDIVNFLDYIGEPMQLERRSLGLRVLAFLLVFFLFAYFLKKEYWKDVK